MSKECTQIVIDGDPRVVADLKDWLTKYHANANMRELKDYINKLMHCLMFGLIDKGTFTSLMYGGQIETVILRDALIEGGGTQLVEEGKRKNTFTRMTKDELMAYVSEARTMKRIEMINDLSRKGQIVDVEEVRELPKLEIKISQPNNIAAKIKPASGLLAPKPPPAPPHKESPW